MDVIDTIKDYWYDTDFYNSIVDLLTLFGNGEKSFFVNGTDVTGRIPCTNMVMKLIVDEFYWFWCRRIYRLTYERQRYFAAGCFCLCYYVKYVLEYKGTIKYDTDKLQFGIVNWDTFLGLRKQNPKSNYDYTFNIHQNKVEHHL